jgi:MscS family membrane protein
MIRRFRLLGWLLALMVVLAPARGWCADGTPAAEAKDTAKDTRDAKDSKDTKDEAEDAPSPESPRASLDAYLSLARDGKYKEAGAYLDLSRAKDADPAVMSRRLKAVLDRWVWFNLDDISGKPDGNLDDGLPRDAEDIAKIPTSSGVRSPVRMVRESSRWVFARATVANIDDWYDQLEDRWLIERLPQALLKPGPRDILWWQWIALPLLLFTSALLGAGVTRLIRKGLDAITKRTTNTWDDTVVASLRGPLLVATTMGFTIVLLPYLRLYPPARAFLHQLVRGALLADFFWVLARLIDAGAAIGRRKGIVAGHATRSLIPLATRVGKVVVLAFAIVAFLSELGYPVASLIAGLGIGGLAFALAAQKTVENLFGAFSIGADQPFREGDTIRVDDLTGTVEVIGLRSTKIRTPDRTLVTIPNGSLAEKRLETFAARDRIRLGCVLGLVYETTADQMRRVLADVEGLLKGHPKIMPNSTVVRFTDFTSSSLKIEVGCYFQTADFDEFQLIRQELLLGFMGIIEKAGTAFAYPTQTLHMVADADRETKGTAPDGGVALPRRAPASLPNGNS